MPFMIVQDDILNIHTDAIANPANEMLQEGTGISKDKLLYDAYMESMELAAELGCESIALSLLPSGKHEFQNENSLEVAKAAIKEFLTKQDMLVYMVLSEQDSLPINQKLYASIEEYIEEHYVEENEPLLEEEESFSYSKKENLEELIEEREEVSFELDKESRPEDTSHLLESCTPIRSAPVPSAYPKRTLENIVNHLDETFSQMLLRLIDERGLKDSVVYKKANVDRRHFSKIRNDVDYVPSKKTVVAFIIALELSMDEAVDIMSKAGFAFSKSSKFDVIIRFFIENKNYDIFELNEVLFTYRQPLLGE